MTLVYSSSSDEGNAVVQERYNVTSVGNLVNNSKRLEEVNISSQMLCFRRINDKKAATISTSVVGWPSLLVDIRSRFRFDLFVPQVQLGC